MAAKVSRAVIIAAGMGSRLGPYTEERPKCMVEVAGRSIMGHQRAALSAHGVEDLHIVRGYLADRLIVEGATYYNNFLYKDNNILHSLMCAREALDRAVLITYSDIVYTEQVVGALLEAQGDVCLVVDRGWARAYEGREAHPMSEAELAEVRAEDGVVLEVGKHVGKRGSETAAGEFIGLMKVSEVGAARLLQVWDEVRETVGDDEPFGHAKLFRKAYLTDLIEEMIRRGDRVDAVMIDGGWREIDTVEDLERASEDLFCERPAVWR